MIFLRFNSESEYDPSLLGDCDSVDVIDTIYSDGEVVPGFHVNVITEKLPEGWEKFVIDRPTNPARVFFGY